MVGMHSPEIVKQNVESGLESLTEKEYTVLYEIQTRLGTLLVFNHLINPLH